MRNPTSLSKLCVDSKDVSLGPYPPLGFVQISDAELGNGDYYGLYWPIGQEENEPLIADMYHDEWSLKLAFSSASKFVEYLEKNDWERGEVEVADEEFAPMYYEKAKGYLAEQKYEEAIQALLKATELFPECAEYWFSLASQFRRIGNHKECAEAVVNAYVSNWAFDIPSQKVLNLLQSEICAVNLPKDPLVKIAPELTIKFGGVNENRNYPLIQELYEKYFEAGQHIKGLLMYQNYAYMMYLETISFQERYRFDLLTWRIKFSEMCTKKLGNSREYGG